MTLLNRAAGALLWSAVVAVGLWCALALLYHPWMSLWLSPPAAAAFTAAGVFLFRKYRRERAAGYFSAAAVAVVLLAAAPRPTHDRPWGAAQAVLPTAEIDGQHAAIGNLRRTLYGPEGDWVEHYDKTFDLGQVESVWFGVQHFSQFKSLAHTFISFGFSDGDYLAISIESRRGEGERFSPLAGMFRNYGIIYVMGDELEVIGRRSALSGDPIYLYPIRASREQVQGMLAGMLRRANELAERPEFYDTWTNNCTNSIVRHFNEVAPRRICPYHPRIAFPGYTARVAYAHGLIDSDETFEAIQQRAHINNLAREAQHPEEFSAAIRRNYNDERQR